jgi:hypothetical protein
MAVGCQTSNESSISDLHNEVVMSDCFMMMDVEWVETVTVCVANKVELCRDKYLYEWVNVRIFCDCRYS